LARNLAVEEVGGEVEDGEVWEREERGRQWASEG
jgi:hypothetical protein